MLAPCAGNALTHAVFADASRKGRERRRDRHGAIFHARRSEGEQAGRSPARVLGDATQAASGPFRCRAIGREA